MNQVTRLHTFLKEEKKEKSSNPTDSVDTYTMYMVAATAISAYAMSLIERKLGSSSSKSVFTARPPLSTQI